MLSSKNGETLVGFGIAQGAAEGYSGVQGATPVGRAGELGHTIGFAFGTAASVFY